MSGSGIHVPDALGGSWNPTSLFERYSAGELVTTAVMPPDLNEMSVEDRIRAARAYLPLPGLCQGTVVGALPSAGHDDQVRFRGGEYPEQLCAGESKNFMERCLK